MSRAEFNAIVMFLCLVVGIVMGIFVGSAVTMNLSTQNLLKAGTVEKINTIRFAFVSDEAKRMDIKRLLEEPPR